MFDKPAVVIDNGSRYIKAGFACDNHPVSMFRTVVGRPSYLNGRYGLAGRADPYEVYIGDDAVTRTDDYELFSPVINGRIENWDNMERVWHHIFYRELKSAPEDRAVILCCSPDMPMWEKIKCCQVFFEGLNVPAVCIQPQSVLALYGAGYTTGITVDFGYDTTDINPVYEGGQLSYAHIKTGLAGAQICSYINNSLAKKDVILGSKYTEIIDDIIKQTLYVTKDVKMCRTTSGRLYTLPSGETIDLRNEAFMAAEYIFQPDSVINEPTKLLPVQNAIVTSALKCDVDLRVEMYSAIVISGGLSMIPGLNERLQCEIENISNKPVNVVTSDESYVVSWLGGATFAGLQEAQKLCVTQRQFEEYGGKIVKNKFL